MEIILKYMTYRVGMWFVRLEVCRPWSSWRSVLVSIVFSNGGFQKWGYCSYPPNHHKSSSYWGTPISGNPQMLMFESESMIPFSKGVIFSDFSGQRPKKEEIFWANLAFWMAKKNGFPENFHLCRAASQHCAFRSMPCWDYGTLIILDSWWNGDLWSRFL